METTTVSLILGCLCAGLIWWLVQGLVRRWTAGRAPQEEAHTERDEAPWERTGIVYRKLLYLRIASIALCALAVAALFFRMGTFLALALAGAGCCLQFCAYHIRTQHVQAVQKAALLEKASSETSHR